MLRFVQAFPPVVYSFRGPNRPLLFPTNLFEAELVPVRRRVFLPWEWRSCGGGERLFFELGRVVLQMFRHQTLKAHSEIG